MKTAIISAAIALLALPVYGLTQAEVMARQKQVEERMQAESEAKKDAQVAKNHAEAMQRTRDRNAKLLADHPDYTSDHIAALERTWQMSAEDEEEAYQDRRGVWKKQLAASRKTGDMFVEGFVKAGGAKGWDKAPPARIALED